jgi:hypothetical protein
MPTKMITTVAAGQDPRQALSSQAKAMPVS